MGFFDNLGKAISDVGQKGKDIASAAKYNRMIADEERDITKAFEQIGKKYFEMHQDDFDPDFSDIFTGVKEAKERIQNYKETIDMLQGIVRCSNCGLDLPEGAAFCPECGTKVVIEKKEEEKPQDPSRYYCPECSKEVKAGMKFCIYCGAEINIPEKSTEPEDAEYEEHTEETVDAEVEEEAAEETAEEETTEAAEDIAQDEAAES